MNPVNFQPYGTWKSPVTAEMLAGATVRPGEVAIDGAAIYWIESRPAEKGRNTIMRCDARGHIEEVLPAPFNARSRVHEYGGGALQVHRGEVFFSNDGDRQVYRLRPGQSPEKLSNDLSSRFADFAVDDRRHRLIVVREQHGPDASAVENTLATLSLNGDSPVRTLVSGADFYANPVIRPDGAQLAWLCWRHPDMPWDATELWLADLRENGTLANPRHIAGGAGESVFQPQWSPDGALYFVSDRNNWWNLYRFSDENIEPLVEMAAEFGLPQWVFGMSTYAVVSETEILCTYTKDGIWQLAQIDVPKRRLRDISTPFTYLTQVRAGRGVAAFHAGSPQQPTSLVRMDAAGRFAVLRSAAPPEIDPTYFSHAQSLFFPGAEGHRIHAFYYPPHNPDAQPPPGEAPPLMVICHGGPTGATDNSLRLKVQYWTTRGFAVLDVNYRGSTGFGRQFREWLYGQWGIADVADCVAGARFLAQQGSGDPARMVISGSSAGGFTALAALTFHDVFSAGCSRYGISDLAALSEHTHKFEKYYNDRLIAPYPAEIGEYRRRSPIYHAERLNKPVIFFQGSDDKVVPPEQSEKMAAALRKKGIPVAYVVFEGEGHGFRQAENIKRALEAEFYFYARIFGFAPADPIAPVPIDNLERAKK